MQQECSNRKLQAAYDNHKKKNTIYHLRLQAAPAASSSEIERLMTLVDTRKQKRIKEK